MVVPVVTGTGIAMIVSQSTGGQAVPESGMGAWGVAAVPPGLAVAKSQGQAAREVLVEYPR